MLFHSSPCKSQRKSFFSSFSDLWISHVYYHFVHHDHIIGHGHSALLALHQISCKHRARLRRHDRWACWNITWVGSILICSYLNISIDRLRLNAFNWLILEVPIIIRSCPLLVTSSIYSSHFSSLWVSESGGRYTTPIFNVGEFIILISNPQEAFQTFHTCIHFWLPISHNVH